MRDKEKQKLRQHESYIRNKNLYLNRSRQRRIDRKIWFNELTKDHKCIKCSYSIRIGLDYHHINPLEKDSEISDLLNSFRSKDRIIKELNKCVCLCANCHRELHANLWDLDKFFRVEEESNPLVLETRDTRGST